MSGQANVLGLLKKLRQREGLTSDRLLRDPDLWKGLTRTPAASSLAVGGHPEEPTQLIELLTGLVAGFEGTDRLVLDAALRLRLTVPAEDPGHASLYADDVTQRRQELRQRWDELHALAGVTPEHAAPSDTNLRTRVEVDALERLARELARRTRPERAVAGIPLGRAVVVGGAAIDHLYRIDDYPDFANDRAMAAASLVEQPGGKGLTLAVALARVGFDVSLVAAIGDDPAGDEIVSYLDTEGVDTTFVDRQPGRTPRVTVLTNRTHGRSFALAWMNREELSIDLNQARDAVGVLGVEDNVLFTLEARFEVVRDLLNALPDELPGKRATRPRTVLLPAPTLADTNIVQPKVLGRIDYLIGHERELEWLVPSEASLAQQVAFLRSKTGVRTIIRCEVDGIEAYGPFDSPNQRSNDNPYVREQAGAREAFTAAFLAQNARLDRWDDPLEERVNPALDWGMAALEICAMQPGLVQGLPSVDEIEAHVERTNS